MPGVARSFSGHVSARAGSLSFVHRRGVSKAGAEINFMPDVVLIDPRHARVAYTTVSPRYEDDEICRILQYELCRTCKFRHVRGWGLIQSHGQKATTRTFPHHHSHAADRSPDHSG